MSGTEDREVPMSVVDKNREGIPQASVDADLLTFSESLNHCKSSLRQETSRMDKSCVARLRHLQGTFLVEAAFAPEHDEGKDFDINNLNASLPGTATAKRAAVFAAASAGAQSDDVAATVVSAESQDTLSTATKDESCLSKLRTLRSQMDLHQNLVLQMVWHELSLRRKAEEQLSLEHYTESLKKQAAKHEQSSAWMRRNFEEKIKNARLAGRENAQGGIAIVRSMAKEEAEKVNREHAQELKDLKAGFAYEVQSLREEVEKSRDELGALRGLREKALADAELARQRLVACEGELAQRNAACNAEEAETKRLSSELTKERERSKMFRQAVKDTQQKLNASQDELADTKEMLEAEAKASDHLKGRVKELEELSEDMQRELEQVDDKIAKANEMMKQAEKEMSTCRHKVETEAKLRIAAERKVEELMRKANQMASRVETAEKEAQGLVQEQSEWKMEKMRLEGEVKAAKQDIGTLKLGALKAIRKLSVNIHRQSSMKKVLSKSGNPLSATSEGQVKGKEAEGGITQVRLMATSKNTREKQADARRAQELEDLEMDRVNAERNYKDSLRQLRLKEEANRIAMEEAMRAENAEALARAQEEHRAEIERMRTEVKKQNETLQEKAELVRSLTSKNIASRFRMAHLKTEAKNTQAVSGSNLRESKVEKVASVEQQEEECQGDEEEDQEDKDEETQREEHKQELAALQKRLEKDMRKHMENELRDKIKREFEAKLLRGLKKKVEREMALKYKKKMQVQLQEELKKATRSPDELTVLVHKLEGKIEKLKKKIAEEREKNGELHETLKAKTGGNEEMSLLIQEKDMLLTELTLMVTAYKKESISLNTRLQKAQVERRELRSALVAARNVELGHAMARIERQLRPQTATTSSSSTSPLPASSLSSTPALSVYGARDEDRSLVARSVAAALPTRGDKLTKKLIRSELKKAFYSGGAESVREMSERLSALGVDEQAAFAERSYRKRPATSGTVRGKNARLRSRIGGVQVVKAAPEEQHRGDAGREIKRPRGSRRPASAAVATLSPSRVVERDGKSKSVENIPHRSRSANYGGRGKQEQQGPERDNERPTSAAPHVGPVSRARIPTLLQRGGNRKEARIVFGNARALLDYRNASAR